MSRGPGRLSSGDMLTSGDPLFVLPAFVSLASTETESRAIFDAVSQDDLPKSS